MHKTYYNILSLLLIFWRKQPRKVVYGYRFTGKKFWDRWFSYTSKNFPRKKNRFSFCKIESHHDFYDETIEKLLFKFKVEARISFDLVKFGQLGAKKYVNTHNDEKGCKKN